MSEPTCPQRSTKRHDSDAPRPRRSSGSAQRFAAARKLLEARAQPECATWTRSAGSAKAAACRCADLARWSTGASRPRHRLVRLPGQQRLCVALRDVADSRRVVLADPFDAATRVLARVAHPRRRPPGHADGTWPAPHDVTAFYARLERETRALDGASRSGRQRARRADAASDVLQALARRHQRRRKPGRALRQQHALRRAQGAGERHPPRVRGQAAWR